MTSLLPLLTDSSITSVLRRGLVALAGGALALGAAIRFADQSDLATWIWAGATVLVLSALLLEIVTELKRGSVGLDIIAALAMAGALAVGETLAGIVVALMYSGGQLLEDFAAGRARREMTALLGRVPKTAIRHRSDGLAEVPIETLVPGDRILIRQGEVVPVDGIVGAGSATLDLSALTGESVPLSRKAGADVLSGSTNEIRAEVPRALQQFRSAGVSRIVLASGDREDVTKAVGSRLDIDEIRGALTPQEKVATVLDERKRARVMMIGDGVNDAPALAAADVGVALGARGAAASSEVADVVLLVDRLDPLADAMAIAQRSRRIALESALVGIGLSAVAMAIAALGYLPPVQGAILQETIDVGVILNGLRALSGGRQSV